MNKYAVLLAAAVFSGGVFAAEVAEVSDIAVVDGTKSPEDLCRSYAQEDGIAENELQSYLEECLKGMQTDPHGDETTVAPTEVTPPAEAPAN